MHPRQNHTNNSDIIASALLVSLGSLGVIVRLGWLTIMQVPQEVIQWWPLLLIVVGVGLWAFDHGHRQESNRRREAKYVD